MVWMSILHNCRSLSEIINRRAAKIFWLDSQRPPLQVFSIYFLFTCQFYSTPRSTTLRGNNKSIVWHFIHETIVLETPPGARWNFRRKMMVAVVYLGFKKAWAKFPLATYTRGPNHVFLFFSMVEKAFLPKGATAQWPPPKYANGCMLLKINYSLGSFTYFWKNKTYKHQFILKPGVNIVVKRNQPWEPASIPGPDHTWSHVITPDLTWSHVMTRDHTWSHLISPDHTWSHLITPDHTWSHLPLHCIVFSVLHKSISKSNGSVMGTFSQVR